MPSVSLYILTLLFKHIKDETFLNLLYSIIFVENINKKLEVYIKECPNPPINYFFDWNKQILNNKAVSFTNCIHFT